MRILQIKISYKVIFIIYFLISANFVLAEQDSSIILGCTNEMALNFNPDATKDDGSCAYTEFQLKQIIEKQKVLGCIDSTAINYNSKATIDDGSCEYNNQNDIEKMILGCTNSMALNFNENATKNDGSCIFTEL